MNGSAPRPAVARVWEGRTPESLAEEYAAYLQDVQVFRRTREGIAEFMTISYWSSREEIRAYAGNDIEKTHHLPKDWT